MKLLLVGNHTCGNRGDGAILRGVLDYIRREYPSFEIDLLSRYPTSSGFLLDEEFSIDCLYKYHHSRGSVLGRFWKFLSPKIIPLVLELKLLKRWPFPLPRYLQHELNKLEKYDAVFQVGGSFFVDLYGESQFEHALCTLIAKKPLFLLGHSVGPFQRKMFNRIASTVFPLAKVLGLRETISLGFLKEANINTSNAYLGADTAWLVDSSKVVSNTKLESLIARRPTIALTMRELAPFDKRLGLTQEEYEESLAKISEKFIKLGYQVIVFSTCTGIESYHKDDRMVALRVQKRLLNKQFFHVVMDELNDVELGSLLQYCQLTIGTRLHSAIISMNFGTRAIALNYEHKSAGIMKQLGMEECSMEVISLFDDSLYKRSVELLDSSTNGNEDFQSKIQAERHRAAEMVSFAIQNI
ncbi:colanic acid biosynthesis pyruvyl transferase WcaK [Paraglaciecola aquimarina]|uniref:Colanic acid biosynthesis pyruvyl transferase WcaK n=1 Tax=Paraglaciecola algarum TaxID=3050085 RepID=A0ABS9D6A1_9ALTE|nr:colanic acid biosynthesis pyruvyl transferase WcaK [Paraglaciecola sp. G1-23]